MHGISVHSALAIKRQRKRREQYVKKYKSKHKRQESQIEEGPGEGEETLNSTKSIGTITSFHIGLIFLFISILLFLSAMITIYNQSSGTSTIDWSEVAELIGTCIICLVIGIFLLVLHRIYNKSEEEKLNNYINRRLCKSKSGNVIYKENSREMTNNIEV